MVGLLLEGVRTGPQLGACFPLLAAPRRHQHADQESWAQVAPCRPGRERQGEGSWGDTPGLQGDQQVLRAASRPAQGAGEGVQRGGLSPDPTTGGRTCLDLGREPRRTR